MRLHKLEITAFGPFSGTEEIDFSALSDAGLFLINGQTGAGKTSVLDAICFALYGQIPGVRNAVKTLRSDHAAAGVGPSIRLETTIRGRSLRITRSPAWERPKLRGSGTKLEQSHVLVEEFTGGAWQGVATRLDEAGDFLGRLLGMNATQFCQVAMLPQGEFAAFLRAGAEERRKVLEKLFATEIYAAVEKWLADRRAATRRTADELAAAAGSTADRIAETSGAERPEVDFEIWATEVSGQLATILDVNESLLAAAQPALAEARAALTAGRELMTLQDRHAKALNRRTALDAAAPQRAALTVRLDAGARADRVVPLIRAASDRKSVADRAFALASAARRRIAALAPEDAPADVLLKTERVRRDEAAGLAQRLGEAQRHQAVLAELETGRLSGLKLAADEAAQAQTLAEMPALVAAVRKELESAKVQAGRLPAAQKAVADAVNLVGSARRRDLVIGSLVKAEDAYRAAVDIAQGTRTRLLDLRQARIEGMAAVLADELIAGEPCKVCGSAEHPDPATGLGVVPSEEDQTRAGDTDDRAQKLREQAGTRVVELRTELDGLLEITDASVEALSSALAEAEREQAACEAAAALSERYEAQVSDADAALTRLRESHSGLQQQLTENRALQAARQDEETRLREALDLARGADPSLDARIRRVNGEADLLKAAADAITQADTSASELSAALAAATRSAADEGFESIEHAGSAFLPAQDRTQLQNQERAFAAEEAAVRELLGDPDLLSAAARPAPDVPTLEAAVTQAESAYSQIVSARDRTRQRSTRLAELRADLRARMAAWAPAAEAFRVAERLAAVTSGVNRDHMRLSAYVLSARLSNVVDAANERLTSMSSGRYALKHTVDKAAGDNKRASGGLGLRIIDGWTGQERDPVTLSGGESFITSLALALGLADVVTAEAGGTEIGTLFVDEGFGTLDEDTLDEVMDVLDGLRDGGRTVGIVSHVAELRTRIPAQLRVSKDRTGSRVSISV